MSQYWKSRFDPDHSPDHRVDWGMNTTTTIVREAWESYTVRLTVLAVALGAVPFYLLSMVMATLSH